MLETLPVMVCLMTPDYHVAFANQAFRDKFGESHGRHCYEYCCGYKEPCGFCQSFKPLETGQPHHWEFTSPDGSTIIDAYDFPFTDVDGSPMILEMDIDITERRRAEEALRESEQRERERAEELAALLDAVPTPVIIARDPDCTHLIGNRAANELLRLPSGGEISMTAPLELKPYHYKAVKEGRELRLDELPVRRVAKGENVQDFEYTLIFDDGNIRELIAYAVPLKDQQGNPRGSVHTLIDVTELKQVQEALKESNETLEEKVKERTAELENASKYLQEIDIVRKQEIHHRIKNNLQVISSLLDLQAEKFRGKKNIEYSQVLAAFKESQDRVISMALIHEELHKGGEIDTLNFSSYIEELTENLFLSYRLGNEDISLVMDVEEDIFFDMDTSVPLGMIINELISNSLKHAFTGRDDGEIRIKLHRDENGECESKDCNLSYVLSVSDNGIGLPEDLDIEDIDSLGLQLVTTLVDQLDGELELKRDNGTEFTIKFTVTERK